MIKYVIPELPKSLNRFAGRNNVWEYRAEKKRWHELCTVFCRPKPKKPLKDVEVRITYVFPDRRRRDLDNYVKYVLDGLTGAGIIADDDWTNISLNLRGQVEKGQRRVEIEIGVRT